MEAPSLLCHSKTAPFCVGVGGFSRLSFRNFNKRTQVAPLNSNLRSSPSLNRLRSPSNRLSSQINLSPLLDATRPKLVAPLKCLFSEAAESESESPFLKSLKSFSVESLKARLLKLTPYDVIIWSGIASVAIAAAKWTVKSALNPFVWMYFSWSWMFWPWIAAILLAAYGLYCSRKHSLEEANIFEQIVVVTASFAWLTLVPSAHFNGFLEGWPYAFFFVYHYFFFFNVSVRKRLYGDYNARPHDSKWDAELPEWKRLLFCAGAMAGHWLAAFEGPELHRIPGGLSNVGVWGLILVILLMQYNSTLYLAKYSEKVVVPTAVVQFGPFRWIRHPIYASTMLLFATYCVALRAPFSMLFLVGVCLCYYDQKAKLEEGLMVEAFGDGYVKYADKVRYKFIPFVY